MQTAETPAQTATRKPRLALMGEFSAGKSTLTNLLLGRAPLPVRVTATRLPPVWLSQGPEAAFAVGYDGSETPVDLSDLGEVSVEETRYIRLFNPSETLEICDLIDMPGISDPNMSTDAILSLADEIDNVVWCTPVTQAWRQSESAMWDQIRPRTNGDNILLITQVDKLRSERDAARVLTRVRKETEDRFRAVYPMSILQAIEAGEDETSWRESGAADFIDHLVELLLSPSGARPDGDQDITPARPATHAASPAAPLQDTAPEVPEEANTAAADLMAARHAASAEAGNGIAPKRVARVRTEMRGRRARPDATL